MVDTDTLRQQLAHAQRQLVCADMIDSFTRRDAETRRWQAEVKRIERELEHAETGFNPHGSGPVPIERREN